MSYENITTKGVLTKVHPPNLVDRLNSDLLSPDQAYETRIEIGKMGPHNDAGTSTTIMGIVPSEYIGREVRVVKSYYNVETRKIFIHEMYVGRKRIINTTTVTKP